MSAVLKLIWSLFGSTIVSMILTAGLPAAIEWMQKKGFPQFLINALVAFAKAILGDLAPVVIEAHEAIKQVKSDDSLSKEERKLLKSAIKTEAKREAKRVCLGVACPPDLVGK